MEARGVMRTRRPGRSQKGVLRLAFVYACLLASLTFVVRRQSRALTELRTLDALRRDRAVVEATRAELVRTLDRLQSRGHVVDLARRELGMHIPAANEIVLLRWPSGAVDAARAAERSEASAAARSAAVESGAGADRSPEEATG